MWLESLCKTFITGSGKKKPEYSFKIPYHYGFLLKDHHLMWYEDYKDINPFVLLVYSILYYQFDTPYMNSRCKNNDWYKKIVDKNEEIIDKLFKNKDLIGEVSFFIPNKKQNELVIHRIHKISNNDFKGKLYSRPNIILLNWFHTILSNPDHFGVKDGKIYKWNYNNQESIKDNDFEYIFESDSKWLTIFWDILFKGINKFEVVKLYENHDFSLIDMRLTVNPKKYLEAKRFTSISDAIQYCENTDNSKYSLYKVLCLKSLYMNEEKKNQMIKKYNSWKSSKVDENLYKFIELMKNPDFLSNDSYQLNY